jgi:FtsP/CotA-like multicopper oxidase with cupredoxin domain
MDGVAGLTQEPVAPGRSFEYRFTPAEPGTFLVRPCVPGRSAEALERGLSAALIVEEPSAPQVDLDLVMLVDDGCSRTTAPSRRSALPTKRSVGSGLCHGRRRAAPLEQTCGPGQGSGCGSSMRATPGRCGCGSTD